MRSHRRQLATALLLAAACRGETIQPPPAAVSDVDPEPVAVTLPPSYVAAPIVFDLRPVLAQMEEVVPKKFGSTEKDKRIQVMKGTPDVWVAPELTRTPFKFSFKDNTVTVATVFEYQAKAWAKALLITYSVSCGTDPKKPKPRIRLALSMTYDLTPDWRLKTRSKVVDLAPMSSEERDQCEISAAKINVSPKVADAAKGAVEKALVKLDEKLSHVSVAKPIGKIWLTLQRPISISKGTLWLLIQPQAVSFGGITASDSALTARLALLAQPRMLSGPRPPDGTNPLPTLGRGVEGADTAMVMMDALLIYPAATKLLQKPLVGKSFGPTWRKIKVEQVTVLPAGKGRLLLSLGLKGRARGTVNVVGTPNYDSTTDLITIKDLSFDVNSQAYLAKAAGWLINGPLLTMVQENAKIPASALMEEVLALANKNINRQLSEGIFLRGNLSSAQPIAVQAMRDGLMAHAKGAGRLWVEISKEDLLPASMKVGKGPKPAAAPPTEKAKTEKGKTETAKKPGLLR
jgi:hypothetical protein